MPYGKDLSTWLLNMILICSSQVHWDLWGCKGEKILSGCFQFHSQKILYDVGWGEDWVPMGLHHANTEVVYFILTWAFPVGGRGQDFVREFVPPMPPDICHCLFHLNYHIATAANTLIWLSRVGSIRKYLGWKTPTWRSFCPKCIVL